jgi:signal transduction histidine kinase
VGLYRLAPDGRLARFGRDQGLRADAFGGVLSDERGHLWVCTRRGLLRLPYADLDAVAAGRAPVVTPARYGVADGMPSAECAETAQPLAARAPDGSLWFATRRGVVAVDPARAFDPALSAPPPVPVIDVVSAPGRRAVGAAEVTLPPRAQELLRFAFTAPTFVSPEAVSFRYRLDPLSEDWLVAGAERTAQFANVRPGTYTFRVVARGASGGDAPGEARVVVHVQPRFTQTPWFAGLIFVGAAAAFGLMYRARQRRLHRQVLAVVAERGRIARDLHDDLNASLMGIKLQLDAAVTLWPDAPEEARRQLEAARAELPRSLAETRRSIWMLRPARLDRGGLAAAIEGFLDQAARGAGIDTAVSARGDARTVGADVEEQAFRIVQEAVTNALKHAQARRIEVEVAVEGRRLQVTVDDDGRGLGAGPAGAAGRFGLAGMTERARAIGGAVAVGPRPGGGTRVCLQVDLGVRAAWRRRLRRLGAPRYVRNWR